MSFNHEPQSFPSDSTTANMRFKEAAGGGGRGSAMLSASGAPAVGSYYGGTSPWTPRGEAGCGGGDCGRWEKTPDYNDDRPGCVPQGHSLPSGMGPGEVHKVLECLEF